MSSERLSQPSPENFSEALTYESFWLIHGEICGFDEATMRQIWTEAECQYTDELPYHNFFHVTETLSIALNLADQRGANDTIVDRRALIVATLFHDAGYQDDHKATGFNSKEERSVSIFKFHADKYGMTADEMATGENAIMATKPGQKPVSVEDKILVRADLDNVTGDFEGFIGKTHLLRNEAKLLGGYKSDVVFTVTSMRVLAEYISNDLSLGDWETNHWSLQASKNIRRLVVEVAKHQGESMTHFVQELGSVTLNKLLLRDRQEDSDDEAER